MNAPRLDGTFTQLYGKIAFDAEGQAFLQLVNEKHKTYNSFILPGMMAALHLVTHLDLPVGTEAFEDAEDR